MSSLLIEETYGITRGHPDMGSRVLLWSMDASEGSGHCRTDGWSPVCAAFGCSELLLQTSDRKSKSAYNFLGLKQRLAQRESNTSNCYWSFKVKLFRETESGFKRALSLKCNTYTYSPGQILAEIGEVYPNLYYIKHGLVQVCLT